MHDLANRVHLPYSSFMSKVMVYILHEREADEGVRQVLTELDIDAFSRFRDSLEEVTGGKGAESAAPSKIPEPHHVTIAVVEESEKGRLLQRLKQLQVDRPYASLRAFVVSVLDAI